MFQASEKINMIRNIFSYGTNVSCYFILITRDFLELCTWCNGLVSNQGPGNDRGRFAFAFIEAVTIVGCF